MAADNEETLIKDRTCNTHTQPNSERGREGEKRPAVGPYGDSRTGGQGFTECKNAAKNRDIKRKTGRRE